MTVSSMAKITATMVFSSEYYIRNRESGGRRRDCHSADTSYASILKRPKERAGATKMTVVADG